MANPSSGIEILNEGGFVCQFRVKTNGVQTELGGNKQINEGITWSYQDLIAAGLKEGDSCWVSVDVVIGETNHESGGNFTLQQDAGLMLKYIVVGGAATPVWEGPLETPAVTVINNGLFIGRMRVKTNGKDSSQSDALVQGKAASWTFTELVSQGFKDGDNCWVSVDVVAGETNHESGDNFNLARGGNVEYNLDGGVWNPSWSLI